MLRKIPLVAVMVFAVIAAINVALLYWVGVSPIRIAGSYLIQITWTLGASVLITRYRPLIRDSVHFYLCAYCAGLILFFLSGFLYLHRGLLGESPRLAAVASIAPFVILAAVRLIWLRDKPSDSEPVQWNLVAALMAFAFALSAISSYGYGSKKTDTLISDPEWTLSSGVVPMWGHHSDRFSHYRRITKKTFEEGFPPGRVNHRGTHVTMLSVTLLTGEMSRTGAMGTLRTLTLGFYFALVYGLYVIGRSVLDFGPGMAGLMACSALVFSPMKVPLFALSPTYRGFFSASGTLYHSDSQYTSTACCCIGLTLLLAAFKHQHRTLFLGCCLVAGSFFLKPSNFMVLAPITYIMTAVCWRDLNRDRLMGLAILMAIPIAWFGYIYYTGASANFDTIMRAENALSSRRGSLTFHPQLYLGYFPRLNGRFPAWIDQSTLLVAATMTGMSFAAFWFAGFTAFMKAREQAKQGLCSFLQHLRDQAHIYFQVGLFLLAVSIAITLGGIGKNANWKWAAAAAYVLCVPLFAKGITTIERPALRRLSWGLFGFQTAQGVGYLWYYFWMSKLF